MTYMNDTNSENLSNNANTVRSDAEDVESVDSNRVQLEKALVSFVHKMTPLTEIGVNADLEEYNKLLVEQASISKQTGIVREFVKFCYPTELDIHKYHGLNGKAKEMIGLAAVTNDNRSMFQEAESILMQIANSGKDPDESIDVSWLDNRSYFRRKDLGGFETCRDAFNHVLAHAFLPITSAELKAETLNS